MKTKTQVRTASAVALRRVAVVAAVLLTLCLVFMMPVGAEGEITTVYNWEDLKTNLSTGGTIVLGQTIEMIWDSTRSPESLEITKDTTLNLNGNDISVSYDLTNPNSYGLFEVRGGTFIITDSSTTSGEIAFKCGATVDPMDVSLGAIKIYNGATVNLQKGDITVDAEPGVADTRYSGRYGVDLYTMDGASKFVMDGGSITSAYVGIRTNLNTNSLDYVGSVTINGGTLMSSSNGIWIQQTSSGKNPYLLEITGGSITSVKNAAVGYWLLNFDSDATFYTTISGGTLTGTTSPDIEYPTYPGVIGYMNYYGDAVNHELEICGGSFTHSLGGDIIGLYLTEKKGPTTSITGGTFSEPSVLNYLKSDADVDVKLTQTITGPGISIPSGTTVYIDFGGHEYIVDEPLAGSTGTKSQAFQLLKGSSITMKNGEISSSQARMLINNYADLTLENMVLDGTNLRDKDGKDAYGERVTLSSNYGSISLKDTTIYAKTEGDETAMTYVHPALKVCYWSTGDYTGYADGTTVTVKDNTEINGLVKFYSQNTDETSDILKSTLSVDGENIKIKGAFTYENVNPEVLKQKVTFDDGTFGSDVSAYVTPEKVCVDKNDGTFVIETISPGISATDVGFDSVKVGYTQPGAQDVTVTNTGNIPVSITGITSEYYQVVGDLPKDIPYGGSATFKIQPMVGLAVGNYEETVYVNPDHGDQAEIKVSFLVYQPSSGGSSTTKPEEPVEPETPVGPENPTEEPEAGEPTVETEVTDGGEVLFEAPVEPETPGADTPSDEPAEPTVTGVVLPAGTDSEVAFIPVSEKPAPAGKEENTKKVFEINVPKYEKGKPATVKFTMTVAELAADGKTAADVALWHQDEETGEWTKLVTTFVIIDGVVYFEAITFDFSPFAIVYEDVSAPTEPETPEQPTESPAPILAVLAGLGAAVILRRK